MFNPELIALPFHVGHTFYFVHGLLRLEPGRLVIECQPVENVLGLIRGPMRTVEIPLRELADVALDKGPFGSRILSLRTLYLHTLRRFPGAVEGVCRLRIRRAHALLADDLASRLQLILSEDSLQQMDEPLSQPQPETKVEQLLKVWDGIRGLLK
ncbi:MAG: hypothetical protein CVV27_06965 [Candidatus Melainabacteria bacterium HGW-Melainabacteria-1]|nr:MAG: hypothetical protein CVV27_06965 [Candidatus Melainabacteria bacterium HGW-Melainabacteria-1]